MKALDHSESPYCTGRRFVPMTSPQTKALEAIIGRLEALQKRIRDPRVKDQISGAKSQLLAALRDSAQ